MFNFGKCKCLHTGHGNLEAQVYAITHQQGINIKHQQGINIKHQQGISMFFSLKKDSRTIGHEVKLVNDQSRLDIRKYSFSQRTINEWNKLSTESITASRVNMYFQFDYRIRTSY